MCFSGSTWLPTVNSSSSSETPPQLDLPRLILDLICQAIHPRSLSLPHSAALSLYHWVISKPAGIQGSCFLSLSIILETQTHNAHPSVSHFCCSWPINYKKVHVYDQQNQWLITLCGFFTLGIVLYPHSLDTLFTQFLQKSWNKLKLLYFLYIADAPQDVHSLCPYPATAACCKVVTNLRFVLLPLLLHYDTDSRRETEKAADDMQQRARLDPGLLL